MGTARLACASPLRGHRHAAANWLREASLYGQMVFSSTLSGTAMVPGATMVMYRTVLMD